MGACVSAKSLMHLTEHRGMTLLQLRDIADIAAYLKRRLGSEQVSGLVLGRIDADDLQLNAGSIHVEFSMLLAGYPFLCLLLYSSTRKRFNFWELSVYFCELQGISVE